VIIQTQLFFALDGLDPGHVLAQSAHLVQALGLSHFHLELQAEELIIQFPLLVQQLGVSQVSKFLYVHVISRRAIMPGPRAPFDLSI
jgi:hypothetical protein